MEKHGNQWWNRRYIVILRDPESTFPNSRREGQLLETITNLMAEYNLPVHRYSR